MVEQGRQVGDSLRPSQRLPTFLARLNVGECLYLSLSTDRRNGHSPVPRFYNIDPFNKNKYSWRSRHILRPSSSFSRKLAPILGRDIIRRRFKCNFTSEVSRYGCENSGGPDCYYLYWKVRNCQLMTRMPKK